MNVYLLLPYENTRPRNLFDTSDTRNNKIFNSENAEISFLPKLRQFRKHELPKVQKNSMKNLYRDYLSTFTIGKYANSEPLRYFRYCETSKFTFRLIPRKFRYSEIKFWRNSEPFSSIRYTFLTKKFLNFETVKIS